MHGDLQFGHYFYIPNTFHYVVYSVRTHNDVKADDIWLPNGNVFGPVIILALTLKIHNHRQRKYKRELDFFSAYYQ